MKKVNYTKLFAFLALSIFLVFTTSCEKDEDVEPTEDDEPTVETYIGTAFVGQSIPVDTKYSYSEGTYSTWVSFIDQSSYNWSQTDVQGEIPAMIVPCEYNTTTGEFSDSIIITHNDETFGRYHYFPISFCIDSMNKMYLFTFDALIDTNLTLSSFIAEKITGSEGTLEGSYKSSFKSRNLYSNADGLAENWIDSEFNYSFGAGTFSGSWTTRVIGESNLSIPEYGIEPISIDSTYSETFSGTWEYNKTDNTISLTITSPIDSNYTFTPYWVSYNDKLYMVTSLTRFYQKEDNGN